ncbi:DUF4365 domain-containing protein [Photobacterium damselae]|uniref:DUF4365 domain-containing protein n=1 Tax=Photobacterium damselae TaxID=38293 RepID=UPI0011D17CDB|nr:DUF4365 domain-containing protein [Photobacterium damselae]KAB1520256.1 DUF4365 domain-containing protein [Photobacterium damselae subsp. damselae]
MTDWPVAPDEEIFGRTGVHLVGVKVHQELGWIFRETSSTDLGIDGEIETRLDNNSSHGKRLSLQIKCGSSYLKEEFEEHFIYRGSYKHLKYWTEFSDPVLIIICDPNSNNCWWQHVDMQNINFHEKGWSIVVPKSQTLSKGSRSQLSEIANLYKKNDLIELLLRDWFGWRFEHQIQFASDLSIPRDYHWLSMLAQTDSDYIMIDYLVADVDGFSLEAIEDMMKYAHSNYRVFGYKHFVLAFISEAFHHLEKIPNPIKLTGLTVQFIPFLLKRRSLELNEVGKNNHIIELYDYEWRGVDHCMVGEIERNIKWSGDVEPCA